MRNRFLHPKFEHHPKIEHPGGRVDHSKSARIYYWIWALSGEGRRIIWGPYQTREAASQKIYSKLGGSGEIIELRTRDEGEASRLLRSRLLDSTASVEDSFKRFKHTGRD